MERSDLSGESVPPGSERTVVVRIDDESRELTVSADEAQGLRAAGRAHGRLRGARSRARKWLPPVLAVIATALLIPAFTKQWSDRPKEVEIQRALVARMAGSASGAVSDMRAIAANLVPEAQLARRVDAGEFPQGDRDAARDEVLTEAKATNEAIRAWETESDKLGAELGTYLRDDDVVADWRAYAVAVRQYQRLSTSVCGARLVEVVDAIQAAVAGTRFSDEERSELVDWAARVARSGQRDAEGKALIPGLKDDYNRLIPAADHAVLDDIARQRFSGESPRSADARRVQWRALVLGQGPGCEAKLGPFATAYGALGDELVRRVDTLGTGVAEAHLEGFSRGPRDLVVDVWPFD